MRIALLNVPYRLPADARQWITVPPQGYGGIQWSVANLIDGLLEVGCTLYLLGAPGSPAPEGLQVVPATDLAQSTEWLESHDVDVVHDHSNGELLPRHLGDLAVVSTFHLTGTPRWPANCVYVSRAQREMAGSRYAPVIRLPVNPARYFFKNAKQDYLLFLGRVSRHKGVKEAAAFAAAAGLVLKVAGPAWEADYRRELLSDFADTVDFLGEVGGRDRLELIANARAVLVMSQPTPGPFGTTWMEPGATVVSEAAASGTPVVATDNGCLSELVPGVGVVLRSGEAVSSGVAGQALASLPEPEEVGDVAVRRWGHVKIATQYLGAYEHAIRGHGWK
ncbi:MAG: glycosyltransferase [Pseudonocardiaceae bacterium]